MDKKFVEIVLRQITENTFKLIGSDWMLITAGKMESYNTMAQFALRDTYLLEEDVCERAITHKIAEYL